MPNDEYLRKKERKPLNPLLLKLVFPLLYAHEWIHLKIGQAFGFNGQLDISNGQTLFASDTPTDWRYVVVLLAPFLISIPPAAIAIPLAHMFGDWLTILGTYLLFVSWQAACWNDLIMAARLTYNNLAP